MGLETAAVVWLSFSVVDTTGSAGVLLWAVVAMTGC
jgi:hypothetical protein